MASIFHAFSGTMSPLVAATSATASSLANVLSFFKLDKPRMQELPTQIITNYRNLAHGDGIDQVNSIALSSSNAVSPVGLNQPFDAETLKIHRIASIPQIISSQRVVTSMAPGTVIMQWSVAPWNYPIVGVNTSNTLDGLNPYAYAPTLAGWAAAPFRFWRGTCVVDVEVVAQAFSKMYLGLSWQPGFGEFATAPSTVQPGTETELLTQVVQVSGNTRARFVIPYKARSHWLRNDMNSQFNEANDSVLTRASTGRVNGTFTIYVINPLTSYAKSGPNTNPVTVFTSVSFPDLQVARPTGVQLTSSRGGIYTAAIAPGLSDAKQVHNAAETPSDQPSAQLSCDHWFGDKIETILDVTRRPTSIGWFNDDVKEFGQVNFSLFTTLPSLCKPQPSDSSAATFSFGNPLPFPNNYAVWFANMYLVWRGEVSYQVFSETGLFTVPGTAAAGTDSVALKLTNCDAYNLVPFPFLQAGAVVAHDYSPTSSTYTDGCFYKPANIFSMPATAAVPYYSENTFQHTIDPGIAYKSGTSAYTFFAAPYTSGAVPGINIAYTLPIADTAQPVRMTVLANTGDNFSYGGIFPPMAVCDFITNGTQTTAVYTTSVTYHQAADWITSVP
jgi:hypothetical protein